MRNTAYFTTLLLAISLVACSSNPPAPVVDRLPASKPSSAASPSAQKSITANRPTYKAGDWRPDSYIVKKGDTLYSIGLEHGYYYKDIAQANNIGAPYNINVGQTLRFNALKDKSVTVESKPAQTTSDDVVITPINADSSSTSTSTVTTGAVTSATTAKTPVEIPPAVLAISEPKAIREPYSEDALKKPLPLPTIIVKPTIAASTAKPIVTINADSTGKPGDDIQPQPKTESKPSAESKPSTESKQSTDSAENIDWAWPTKGKVIANFNEASNKGIDIAGTTGQAITATAAGKVIYSGSDLRGYGKLVIIKHNATYLSVYAHNSLILAKEGQQVSRGQKIAEMGNTDSDKVKLHFEIRRQGKSVDPGKYLTPN
ncbi:MAG: peptidoglycan DD-metalloendopeptidase family protein [Methylotenera sp.]|uniref:peptidoglycan DD-metalloendopeptidase family protein n=1 Tax=Methylotenera sp. TaxID=2051956 RepID=UPI00271DB8A1|nr:peptidoglycan DD-metalloendopeptidase family protein [Methylotenera sp.]MDO9393029.1 peptidoglycan DD-metalloendopeptidase family protein [Methylotenera sp.]